MTTCQVWCAMAGTDDGNFLSSVSCYTLPRSLFLRTFLWIFPVAVFGSSWTNSTWKAKMLTFSQIHSDSSPRCNERLTFIMAGVKRWEAAQLGAGMVKFLTTHLSWLHGQYLQGQVPQSWRDGCFSCQDRELLVSFLVVRDGFQPLWCQQEGRNW